MAVESSEEKTSRSRRVVAHLWASFKRELKVALKTFGVVWLALTIAFALWCLYDSPKLKGVSGVLTMMSVGFVLCSFYTFWPALGVTACRSVYRVLGWGAYVGAFLIALGVVVSLVLFRHVFGSLIVEVFTGATFSGPCGGHAGGPAAVLALFCMVMALITSPASWWALIKLFLALSVAVLLGALPGVLLWVGLVLRKVVKVASAGISR